MQHIADGHQASKVSMAMDIVALAPPFTMSAAAGQATECRCHSRGAIELSFFSRSTRK